MFRMNLYVRDRFRIPVECLRINSNTLLCFIIALVSRDLHAEWVGVNVARLDTITPRPPLEGILEVCIWQNTKKNYSKKCET